MPFTLSSTLGSSAANLGEFSLGVIEQAGEEISFACQAQAAAAFTGSQTLVGTFAAAGSSSAAFKYGIDPMVLPLRKPARLVKPLSRALDLADPLSRDLHLLALLDERAGMTAFNCAGPSGVWTNSASPTWGADANGTYAKTAYDGSAHYFNFGQRADLAPSTQVTVAALAMPATTERQTILSRAYGFNGWDWLLASSDSTSGLWMFRVRTASGNHDLTFAVAAGVPNLIVCSYDGSTMVAYLNGVQVASSVINSALQVNSSSYTTLLCEYASASTFLSPVYAAWMWTRALAPTEVTQLWERPYGMLAAPRRIRALRTPFSLETGNFACAGKATAAYTGTTVYNSGFTADGKGTAAFTGTTFQTGNFDSSGKGSAAFSAGTVWGGAFQADGSGTAAWTGAKITEIGGEFTAGGRGTAEWTASVYTATAPWFAMGVGTAAFTGTAELHGEFECDGVGTAFWTEASTPISGVWKCDGVGTASWTVGLDAVFVTCLTPGSSPGAHKPNFVH